MASSASALVKRIDSASVRPRSAAQAAMHQLFAKRRQPGFRILPQQWLGAVTVAGQLRLFFRQIRCLHHAGNSQDKSDGQRHE